MLKIVEMVNLFDRRKIVKRYCHWFAERAKKLKLTFSDIGRNLQRKHCSRRSCLAPCVLFQLFEVIKFHRKFLRHNYQNQFKVSQISCVKKRQQGDGTRVCLLSDFHTFDEMIETQKFCPFLCRIIDTKSFSILAFLGMK